LHFTNILFINVVYSNENWVEMADEIHPALQHIM